MLHLFHQGVQNLQILCLQCHYQLLHHQNHQVCLHFVEHLQHHLLVPCSPQQLRRRSRLLQAVDGLNQRFGTGTVQWAAVGVEPDWCMRRQHLSAHFTTSKADLPVVSAHE